MVVVVASPRGAWCALPVLESYASMFARHALGTVLVLAACSPLQLVLCGTPCLQNPGSLKCRSEERKHDLTDNARRSACGRSFQVCPPCASLHPSRCGNICCMVCMQCNILFGVHSAGIFGRHAGLILEVLFAYSYVTCKCAHTVFTHISACMYVYQLRA